METFSEFSQLCCLNSALYRYWDGIIKLSNMLKGLVEADREGNWTFASHKKPSRSIL